MIRRRDDIDPVTGYATTGHDWNGIRELNTPLPRIAVWALVLTFLYSVLAWVLLPAWPVGDDYTRGLLGLDQVERAEAAREALKETRSDWLTRFADQGFSAATDPELRARAWPAAARLFEDNCAPCHGRDAGGGPGFPNLRDSDWLWGGAPDDIALTLRIGINADHAQTRAATMPAFGRDGILDRDEIAEVVEHVLGLPDESDDPGNAGAVIFADNCAACHGDGGAGGLANGAPALNDDSWIYGGDRQGVLASVRNGREGVMPAWEGRLSQAEINLIAAWVADLNARDTP